MANESQPATEVMLAEGISRSARFGNTVAKQAIRRERISFIAKNLYLVK